MTEQFRTEKDSMGEFQVPINAKYGASTARAVENFPISNLRFSRSFIKALGEIKKACAKVNHNNKLLDKNFADSIIDAAQKEGEGTKDLRRNPSTGAPPNLNNEHSLNNIACISCLIYVH